MKLDLRRPEAKATVMTILTLAWPTIIEQVMQTAVQYIDTAMVGALGTQATAAVGATGTVGWMLLITISAVGVGFLSFIATACGANDREAARKAVSQAVFMVLVLGTVFFVLLDCALTVCVTFYIVKLRKRLGIGK